MKKLPARLKSQHEPCTNSTQKTNAKIWRAATIILLFTICYCATTIFAYSSFTVPVYAACNPSDYSDCPVARTGPKIAGNTDPENYAKIRQEYNAVGYTNQWIPTTVIYTVETPYETLKDNLEEMKKNGLLPIIRPWDSTDTGNIQRFAGDLNLALSEVSFAQEVILYAFNEPNLPDGPYQGDPDKPPEVKFAEAISALIQGAGENPVYKIYLSPMAGHQDGAEEIFARAILDHQMPDGRKISEAIDGAALTMYQWTIEEFQADINRWANLLNQYGVGNIIISELGPYKDGHLLQNFEDIPEWEAKMSEIFQRIKIDPSFLAQASLINTSFFLDTDGDGKADITLLVIIHADGTVEVITVPLKGSIFWPDTPTLPGLPGVTLTCTPSDSGDRTSRPVECDPCNLTYSYCPSCATSFTVFDEAKWQWKERDLVCEGEGNPDWKITPWGGTIIINPTDTEIPFVGKKGEESEEKYLADYFEGTTEYYKDYGMYWLDWVNYAGVWRKLSPMGYQDQLKKEIVKRAMETEAQNIHEKGVHDYKLEYRGRLCWDFPFLGEVFLAIARRVGLSEIPGIGHIIDLIYQGTNYCVFEGDFPGVFATKTVIDTFNRLSPIDISIKMHTTDKDATLFSLDGHFPPEPDEENYIKKWNEWKKTEWGKLWTVVPMFSHEDTPGEIIPYLGSKPLDIFTINNPKAQVEKVPHVARLYESTQEAQKILIPSYKEDLQFVQNKSEPILASAKNSQPIIASPAEKKVQGEKILLAQGPGCVPCGYKYYYGDGPSGDDCSCMGRIKPDGEPECRGEPSLGGGCPDKKHWHIYGTICGWSDPKPIERGCNPPDKLCCGGFVNPNPPPDIPACGLPEAWPVDQCEMLAITDPNENDGLCCEPINIKLEAKDMFNDYPYTPCDYSCGPTGTELCNPECNTWEHRTVNREIGINLLHPYLTDVWEQTGKADTQGLFNLFRPAKVSEFQEIDAASEISYSQTGFKSLEPPVGKFYFNYLGGVQLSKEWVINTLMPYVE